MCSFTGLYERLPRYMTTCTSRLSLFGLFSLFRHVADRLPRLTRLGKPTEKNTATLATPSRVAAEYPSEKSTDYQVGWVGGHE